MLFEIESTITSCEPILITSPALNPLVNVVDTPITILVPAVTETVPVNADVFAVDAGITI